MLGFRKLKKTSGADYARCLVTFPGSHPCLCPHRTDLSPAPVLGPHGPQTTKDTSLYSTCTTP